MPAGFHMAFNLENLCGKVNTMRTLITGIFVAVFVASLGGVAEAAKVFSPNSPKHKACVAEARASCAPRCVPSAVAAAYKACMKR
jgi:hypothetical protein